MIQNFLTMVRRNKTAFGLNVVGLSVAFTVLTVITIQMIFEYGYDRSYKDADRIYRLEYFDKAGNNYGAEICLPLVRELAANTPGIESYAVITSPLEINITLPDEQMDKKELKISYARVTSDFFDLFSAEIIAGDPKTCLEDKSMAIIPLSLAQRMYGTPNALGKTFEVSGYSVSVGAIYKDFPKNASVKNVIYKKLESEDWAQWSYIGYFKLAAGASLEQVEQKVKEMDLPQVPKDDLENYKKRITFELTSLKDAYFKSKVYEEVDRGSLTTIFSLIAIAVLILVIAYVNFINFSTALAPVRIKKINTQRVMGAMPGELRKIIIVESVVISLIALALSFVWTNLFMASPAADFFTAPLILSAHIPLLIAITGLAVLLGILAGIYPAFYMTSFPPALVLKGTFALSPSGTKLRNTLLLFQFITTIALITIALFVKLQHTYMQSMDTGFDRENIVYVSLDPEMKKQMDALTNELMLRPEIIDNTRTAFLPGAVGMRWGRPFEGKSVAFSAWPVSRNFLRFFNMKIAEGTDFFAHDEKGVNKIVFNRKFLEKYDFKENIIGKEVGCFSNTGQVVGIAENINFNSVRDEIDPMAFVCGDDQRENFILLKVSGINLPATIDYIKKTCKQFSTQNCDVRFLDQTMAKLYQKEENFSKLITIFGAITILISLMGIYGLILFNTRFKIKEIGIRKVNGATELQMLVFLNKGFIRLIIIAFIMSVPIAWYIVNAWLESFPYKTPVYWWVFLLAGIMILSITFLTVSWQSWKAATINPVKTLQNE